MNTEEEKVKTLLKGVIDPELMVNIIDLGLVYDIRFNELENKIDVDLTLTSPGCPMGELIIEDMKQLITSNYTNFKVLVNLVWEPPWTLDNLTKEGKITLNRD